MRIENEIKVLEPGDKIRCRGVTTTIKTVAFQEYYKGDGFDTEFTDVNGIYRNWKQWADGGIVIPKEEKCE
jgi:hypothetical protein